MTATTKGPDYRSHRRHHMRAVEIARKAVDRLFVGLLTDRNAVNLDWSPTEIEGVDKSFERVFNELERAEAALTGSQPPNEDDDPRYDVTSIEAGYLVGVQVGYRMRNVGGAS
jgi:hypothetical protein